MPEPHYYLKDKQSKSRTPIFLHYYINKRRFKYATGFAIKPILWSSNKERILSKHPNSSSINAMLDKLQVAVVDQYQKLALSEGSVDFSKLKAALKIIQGGKKENDDLVLFYQQQVVRMKEEGRLSANTIKTYVTTTHHVKRYELHTGKVLQLSDVSIELWNKVETFLLQSKHNGKGYASNTIDKIMKRLLTILRLASKKGLISKDIVNQLKISTKREETTAIYLTEEEVEKLYNIDYSDNKRLERARDLFLVGCVTGLRYGDFVRVGRENLREIEGYWMLDWLTEKTKEQVIVPAHEILIQLIDKYNGQMPRLSDQKLRDYLKEIGQGCGFLNSKVNNIITRGGKKTSRMVPRWQLLQTHTARRSFATNAYKSGYDTILIMKMTGHTSEASFLNYIRIGKEENALIMAQKMAAKQNDQVAKTKKALLFLIRNSRALGLEQEKDQLVRVLNKLSYAQ